MRLVYLWKTEKKRHDFLGCITFGVPSSPNLCVGIAGEKNRERVFELNRLVLKDNQKNHASFLIARSLKLLPGGLIIVSYADTGYGHSGYVYQATNFYFSGTTKERTDAFAGEGKHSRHATDYETRVKRTAKHRYIIVTGNKREKKEILKQIKYPLSFDYPKGNGTVDTTQKKEIIEQGVLL